MQRAGSRASGGFLSTPSARRATAERQDADPPAEISIHALREEGDVAFFPVAHHCHNFYPRPPRGGRRYVQEFAAWVRRFLSTPSARRATFFSGGVFYWDEFLSTPSARRATPGLCPDAQAGRISIHALREEGDQKGEPITIPLNDFYPRPPRGGRPSASPSTARRSGFLSTPSARRATSELPQLALVGAISIHALREKGDVRLSVPRICEVDFYPRPPRGGRHIKKAQEPDNVQFLSTPSARRATKPMRGVLCIQNISIHALREEGDFPLLSAYLSGWWISIHALREEGDRGRRVQPYRRVDFYPRPPRGGRRPGSPLCSAGKANFYPRPPRGGRPASYGSDCVP